MTSSQVPCSKGIECPFGSSLDALLSGSSPFGDRFVPKIQPGWVFGESWFLASAGGSHPSSFNDPVKPLVFWRFRGFFQVRKRFLRQYKSYKNPHWSTCTPYAPYGIFTYTFGGWLYGKCMGVNIPSPWIKRVLNLAKAQQEKSLQNHAHTS